MNCKASNYSPVMPPHSSFLHKDSTLASTTGDAVKLAQNASPFGEKTSTPDPDLKEAHRKNFLSTLSSLNYPNLSIAWTPYQSPSSAPLITAFLTIARTKNDELQLHLISCTHPNGDYHRATVSVSGLLDFT